METQGENELRARTEALRKRFDIAMIGFQQAVTKVCINISAFNAACQNWQAECTQAEQEQ